MSKQLVKRVLEEEARNNILPQPDLWLGLRERLQVASETPDSRMEALVGQPTVEPKRRKLSPARWLVSGIVAIAGLSIAGLLIVALNVSLGGFGLFGNSTSQKHDQLQRECIEQKLSALDCMIKTQLAFGTGSAWLPFAKNVELRQENNGFKLTVRKIYADAHSVVIGYELTSTTAIRVSMVETELLDQDGNRFGWTASFGSEQASLTYFNGSIISGNPSVIKARFQIKNIIVMPASPDASNLQPPSSSNLPPNSSGATSLSQTTDTPVNFDVELEIPYSGGRKVELNQKAIAAGRELTLTQVIVAPSGSQFYLDGGMPGRFTMQNELNAGGHITSPGSGSVQFNKDILIWNTDLTPYLGLDWTLTVSELSEEKPRCRQRIDPNCSPVQAPLKRWTSGGPWKFTLRLDK